MRKYLNFVHQVGIVVVEDAKNQTDEPLIQHLIAALGNHMDEASCKCVIGAAIRWPSDSRHKLICCQTSALAASDGIITIVVCMVSVPSVH